MKRKFFSLIIILIIIGIISLASVNYIFAGEDSNSNYGSNGALSDNNITMEESLIYSIQDEYIAQAEYSYIISKFGNISPFNNITKAEITHSNALTTLFTNYNFKVPVNDAANRIIKVSSLEEALEIGIESEIKNIAMYDTFLKMDLPDDVKNVYNSLKKASNNHLLAFEKGLSNLK